MAIIPMHRIDHVPTYILKEDSAWNRSKINKEVQELDDRYKDDPLDEPDAADDDYIEKLHEWRNAVIARAHPVDRYHGGYTRYDIEAENIKDYIDMSKSPLLFRFRRLDIEEYEQVRNLIVMNQAAAAYRRAFQMCIKSIDGIPSTADIKINMRGGMSIVNLDKLREWLGLDRILEVGQAIVGCSADLTESEKKA